MDVNEGRGVIGARSGLSWTQVRGLEERRLLMILKESRGGPARHGAEEIAGRCRRRWPAIGAPRRAAPCGAWVCPDQCTGERAPLSSCGCAQTCSAADARRTNPTGGPAAMCWLLSWRRCWRLPGERVGVGELVSSASSGTVLRDSRAASSIGHWCAVGASLVLLHDVRRGLVRRAGQDRDAGPGLCRARCASTNRRSARAGPDLRRAPHCRVSCLLPGGVGQIDQLSHLCSAAGASRPGSCATV